MLPYDKYWLQHEMHLIESQMKKDKLNRMNNLIMCKWVCCLLLLFVSIASAHDVFVMCPHCDNYVQLRVIDENTCNVKVKDGQWKCPRCNYMNDNRIRYCGLCGAERQ